MKTRRITFWTIIVVLILAIAGFYLYRAHSSQSTNSARQSTVATNKAVNSSKRAGKKGKILIVYFSRRKGVYNQPNLKRGNTEVIADDIQAHTKADIYQIKPVKPYPNGYNATTKVAQKEQDENARPAIKGQLPNVNKYQIVFIGAPVWWGEYPMIVRTFMDKEPALNGKILIPFSTNEGSGLANFPETLHKQFPKSTVRKGLAIEGTQARSAKGRVDRWLNSLGY